MAKERFSILFQEAVVAPPLYSELFYQSGRAEKLSALQHQPDRIVVEEHVANSVVSRGVGLFGG